MWMENEWKNESVVCDQKRLGLAAIDRVQNEVPGFLLTMETHTVGVLVRLVWLEIDGFHSLDVFE